MFGGKMLSYANLFESKVRAAMLTLGASKGDETEESFVNFIQTGEEVRKKFDFLTSKFDDVFAKPMLQNEIRSIDVQIKILKEREKYPLLLVTGAMAWIWAADGSLFIAFQKELSDYRPA